MKRFRNILSIILALLLVLGSAPITLAATNVTVYAGGGFNNPHFADQTAQIYYHASAPVYYGNAPKVTYLTDATEASAAIRDALELRQTSFTVHYRLNEILPDDQTALEARINEIVTELWHNAFIETDKATQGDSLQYAWKNLSYGFSGSAYPSENYTDGDFTFQPIYYTTAAQEAELTTEVNKLVSSFGFTESTTEREKVDTIYQWLCDNVTYDYDNLEDESYTLKFTAYAAMIHKSAVCEGYAVLFYRLAEECGLDARVITGKAGEKMEAHGWNIVKIGDEYYYLDATWDAEKQPEDYDYYLKGEGDFPSHYNDDKFNEASFRNQYPIAKLGLTAGDTEYTMGDWKIKLSGSQAVITAYLGNDKNVVVPAAFDLNDYGMGTAVLPVDSVAMNVFAENHTVESITISEGVDRLAIGAINYCANLKELHLPSTLQMNSYGFSAFTEAPMDCYNLERITLPENSQYLKLIDGVLYTKDLSTLLYCPPKSAHTEINVPEGVEVIGNAAFHMHKTLETITLPSTLIEMDYMVFSGIWTLKEITLPDSLRYIGQYALGSCGITAIHIPKNVETMLSGVFHNTKLKNITVDSHNTTYRMENDMLIGGGILYKYLTGATAESITVPSDVTHVDHSAFEGAPLKNVTLPLGLESIGSSAFSDCKNLTHVTVPDGVYKIGDHAFSGCDMLISIIIPEGVSDLGKSLFHLGPPETYVTVFCSAGGTVEAYCIANNIAYKTTPFPCFEGHNVEKIDEPENSTTLSDTWHYACSVCGCGTRSFVKLYQNINEVTYKIASTTHIYDGTRFLPEVEWVKMGDTLLTEGVDYELLYGDNLTPGGTNHLYIVGKGDFRSTKHVHITIKKVPMQSAVVTLPSYEYEYTGDAQQPFPQSVVLNGKTLTYGTDYVLYWENNVAIGTASLYVRGTGYYEGDAIIPFTIIAHKHVWGTWQQGSAQHFRACTVPNCNEKQFADHQYTKNCEECDVCFYNRANAHSFTNKYAHNDSSHWLICDKCSAIGLSYAHSGGTATCKSQAQCTTCGELYGSTGEHGWESDFNTTQHWERCKYCDDTRRTTNHYGGTATCQTQARCEGCDQLYGSKADHVWSENYIYDETYHWQKCQNCTAVQNKEKHDGPESLGCGTLKECSTCHTGYGDPKPCSGGIATCTSYALCQYCSQPYGDLAPHQSIKKHNNYYHWDGCQNCDLSQNRQEHYGGTATCQSPALCEGCNTPYGATASHSWKDEWIAVSGGHAHTCRHCDATTPTENHRGGTATCSQKAVCSVCATAYGNTLSHSYTNACDTDCNLCNEKRSVSHSYGAYVYNNDATASKNGTKTRTCSLCGATQTITASGTMLKPAFRDVSPKEFYAIPVNWAVSKGVTTGTSATTFSPNDDCTRGQIVAFLWRAAGQPKPKSNRNPFTDVSSNQYYYKAVLWAVEKGITTGTSSTTFSPNASCTRSQVVTFLWRAKGKPAMSASNPFADISGKAYYYSAVLWAVEKGITNGVSPTAFGPEQTCTRGQIVTFLYRAYK